LTETSVGTFVNARQCYRLGTVGLPLPGTDVRIAEDGKVLVRGLGVTAVTPASRNRPPTPSTHAGAPHRAGPSAS